MDVYRELQISGDPSELPSLVGSIESSLANGWVRDKQAELRAKDPVNGNGRRFCFSCEKTRERRAALLVLSEKSPGVLYVPNIIPTDGDRLSRGEYNRIIEEFCDRFVRPLAENSGVTVDMTGAQADLETWLSPTAAEKLRRFSAMANKSTGSSHPSDQERWLDFIVTTFREGGKLDESLLRRWLLESERWPEEIASDLTSEYQFGLDLLRYAHRS